MKKLLVLILTILLSLSLTGCFEDWGDGFTVTVNDQTVVSNDK